MPEPGLVHIYTGEGKGKTTAAMGLALRASGHEFRIYIMQFLKGRKTGEKLMLEKFENVEFVRAGNSTKFFHQMNVREQEKLKKDIAKAWEKLEKVITDSKYDIIILDEIMAAVDNNIVDVNDVISLIECRGKNKELILTGRSVPEQLIKYADYVTEMKMVKHPFTRNIGARRGIEY